MGQMGKAQFEFLSRADHSTANPIEFDVRSHKNFLFGFFGRAFGPQHQPTQAVIDELGVVTGEYLEHFGPRYRDAWKAQRLETMELDPISMIEEKTWQSAKKYSYARSVLRTLSGKTLPEDYYLTA